MRQGLILLIVLILPTLGSAETVKVRSGVHDGFTRLVLYLPAATTWTLEEEDGSATLATDPPAAFDLSEVYDAIPRNRLTALRTGARSGQIMLDLGCGCDLRTETLVGNTLVLDIVDRVTGPVPAHAKARDPAANIAEARRLTEELTRPFGALGPETAVDRSQRMTDMETEILQQVARATTQGLLVPVRPEPPMPAKSPPPVPEQPMATQKPTSRPPPPSALAHTSTVHDEGGAPTLTSDGLTCLPDKHFDVAAWAGDQGFMAGLGQRRAALTGEFDRVDPKAVHTLARFYIAYGFGAEATAALALLPDYPPEPILASMARIVEHGHDPRPSPFAGQQDCDAAVSLWSILSIGNGEGGIPPDPTAVLRTLNALPLPLRDHIGVILADRYQESGRPELARAVLRVVDRAGDGAEDRQTLVEAKIALAEGDQDTGREALEETVEKSLDISPEALIALIDNDLAEGRPVSADTADLTSTYVFQYRSGPMAVPLQRAEILARASAGQIDDAYALLSQRSDEGFPDTEAGPVRSDVTDFLISQSDDTTFLRHGLTQVENHLEDLSPATSLALADRFLSLGFPDLATRVLTGQSQGESRQESALLLARAALASGRPAEATEALTGQSGTASQILSARARAASGNHTEAAEAFERLDMTEDAQRQAWLAADWTRLTQSPDPITAAAARLMTDATAGMDTDQTSAGDTENAENPGILARNRRLLDESGTARATISDLLTRYATEGTATEQ